MDWNALFNYLGTGGGLIVLLNWLAGLPLLKRRKRLEKDDVSRLMAEKDNETIFKLYDEIRDFQARMSRLEGCVAKIVVCPMYDRCPARHLVQDYREDISVRAADSLRWERKVTATLATIPSSLATLRVPIDSLRRLPEGATYTQKEGQATASVGLEGETIVIHAGCDSLQALVLSLEERLDRAQEELANTLKVKEPPDIPFWMTLKGYLTGVLAGLALGWVLARKRNQDS